MGLGVGGAGVGWDEDIEARSFAREMCEGKLATGCQPGIDEVYKPMDDPSELRYPFGLLRNCFQLVHAVKWSFARVALFQLDDGVPDGNVVEEAFPDVFCCLDK